MRALSKSLCAAAAAIGVVAALAGPASAACTRLGFSVNDYGKDGPTNDAKDLLDKYIAKTMGDRGITNYRTGKKDVTCELFLNFIVFDEHTCRADATVCWDDTPMPKGQEATASTPAAPAAVAKKPAAKTAKVAPVTDAAPAKSVKTEAAKVEDTPAEAAPVEAAKSEPVTAATEIVTEPAPVAAEAAKLEPAKAETAATEPVKPKPAAVATTTGSIAKPAAEKKAAVAVEAKSSTESYTTPTEADVTGAATAPAEPAASDDVPPVEAVAP